MIGTLILRASLGFSLLAFLGYVRSIQTSSSQALRIAWSVFFVSALLTVVSAGVLLSLILSHQFQYSYVWNFSSRDLPFPLLLSTLDVAALRSDGDDDCNHSIFVLYQGGLATHCKI